MEDFRHTRRTSAQYKVRHVVVAPENRQPIIPAPHTSTSPAQVKTINIRLGIPRFLRRSAWRNYTKFALNIVINDKTKGLLQLVRRYFNNTKRRVVLVAILAVLILSIFLPAMQDLLDNKVYALSRGEDAVLLHTDKSMAAKLKLDNTKQAYMFNQDYKPANPANDIHAGGSLIKAQINEDPSNGVVVTDPINNVDFTIKPLFKLGTGKQQQNRVVFPAFNGGGHLVYAAGAIGVKQEVTLQHEIGDNLKYSYEMELGDLYAARLLPEGSVGVYGSSLPLNGNVSTGDAKDAALLKKARQKAIKDKLLFTLPAPTIKESNNHLSDAHAKYVLKGNRLDVVVAHLKDASYPLSIDPTVTAASGSGLFSFDANIETNVYVDTSNNFFERSPLTGGNLLTWTGSSSAAAVHFLGATVVYGGTMYIIGGTNGTTTTNISNGASSHLIEQSKINSDGTLAGFSDGNYSGLPSGGLSRFQVLTYNGYIYLIDGINGFTSTAAGGTVSNAVYYARVTSESFNLNPPNNGSQLKNWSTTTNKPSTAIYDYGATVYNGSMYVAGGLNSGGTAQTAVLYAAILPNGDLGTFNTGTALSAGRFGMDMQAYNGHLYVFGGNTGTLTAAVLTATTLYSSIASDGSIADSAWKSGNTLVSSAGASIQAMENFGTQYSMIYNGYLYLTGGCTAVNSTGSCTAVASYSQLAQINADGSLGTFFPNDFQSGGNGTLARTGTPTVGYNGKMYSIAGCSAMNAATVSCATTSLTSNYVAVNTVVGDISANRNPTSLPVALMGHATVVLNGYLYVIGGCNIASLSGGVYDCATNNRVTSYSTYYAAINADGSLGSWTTNTVATNATALHFDVGEGGNNNCDTNTFVNNVDHCGLAGISAAVYNGFIYVVGGYDGTAYSRSTYYMQPNTSTGATVAWSVVANALVAGITEMGLIAYNGALYSIGGCNGATGVGCTTEVTTVQKATINSSGVPTTFSITNQLQLPTNGKAAFGVTLYGGYIYLAGGIDSGTGACTNISCGAQTTTILRAKIDSSGNIVAATGAAWAATTGTMSAPRRRTVAQVVNGYLYVIGGHDASANGGTGATYGDIQIGKIDLSSGGTGDIAGFTQSATSTLTPRWNPAVAFGSGFMYVTGGCTAGPPPAGCTTIGTTDESFTVYNANSFGVNTWNTPSNVFTTNRLGAGTAVYNGYLYLIGGCITYTTVSWNCSNTTGATTYAVINADGSLGAWSSSSPSLPTTRGWPGVVAANGSLYVIGGNTVGFGTGTQTVYKSTIGAGGLPGAFVTTGQAQLPGAVGRTEFGTTLFAGYIYLAGGYDTANSTAVYLGTFDGGGNITTWTTTGVAAITTGRRDLSLVSAGAYLYAIGGYDGTNAYADVQMAQPSTTDGTISSWTKVRELPYKLGGTSAVGANGYLFVFGGRSADTASGCSSKSYVASVNADGTIGEWQQAPNTLASARFGTAAAFYNGYFVLSGGHDCSNILTANIVQQSGQLSEAVHATYTRYVDFGTDATFRQLYVLGTNAQISGVDIDRWKIAVKTSTSSNNTWGQKTFYTLTGLNIGPAYGTPITFQALDASGVDQGAAQYWDITFDIDQAQSFSFPDAATPPQITKYDFYFSPGPGKRLRDGKTFVNETQSTLDAHP